MSRPAMRLAGWHAQNEVMGVVFRGVLRLSLLSEKEVSQFCYTRNRENMR